MAISTDRFRVKSIRPAEYLRTDQVPKELQERVLGKVVAADDLGELGVQVKAAQLYHGGESLVAVYWKGDEYELTLEPAA